LDRLYATLHKSLSTSSSTKQKKKLDDEFVPVYPQVLQSIGEMAQMRINVCARLPADHPLKVRKTQEGGVELCSQKLFRSLR